VIVVVMIFFFMLFPKLYITIVILSKRCNYKRNDCWNSYLACGVSGWMTGSQLCFNGIISCYARVYSCYRCS
jgi:hypothetical protein